MMPLFKRCIFCKKFMIVAECVFTGTDKASKKNEGCFHMGCYMEKYP